VGILSKLKSFRVLFFEGENLARLGQKICNQTFVCHPKMQAKIIKFHVFVKYSVPVNILLSVLYRVSERAACSGSPLTAIIYIHPVP
jgi:hypothetical protein